MLFRQILFLSCISFSVCSQEPLSWPAADITVTLEQISSLRQVNILYNAETLTSFHHPEVNNNKDTESLLRQLLQASSLAVSKVAERTFVIMPTTREIVSEPEPTPHPIMDEVIATGTRLGNVTVHNALSPVDVIRSPMNMASVDLLDGLALQLPSYTAFRLPLSDGQIFNRRYSLRGLNSDHTLVLVNGKRRHRSAFIETANGQPTDLSHIPLYAIKRIEVLRDGASAMYGSDAIAGVINVILDESTGTSFQYQTGQYYEGDGTSHHLQFRHGWQAMENLKLSVVLAGYKDAPTSRSVQPADAVAFQHAHPEINLANPVQRWGQPARKGLQSALTGRLKTSEHSEWYSFVTLSSSEGESDFNWRNPDTNIIFTDVPAFPDYQLTQRYPAGFTPRFGQQETDLSITIGRKHVSPSDVHLDISSTAGKNEIAYFIDNTVNASLGPASPTSFAPGKLVQREWTADIDYRYPLSGNAYWQYASLAMGMVSRIEDYQVTAGDTASWQVGPGAIYGLPAGANGFPGYSDAQAGRFSQQSLAAYADLNIHWPHTIVTGAAIRVEHNSDYNNIVRGKLSIGYQGAGSWTFRANLTNGFRAPSAGQRSVERTSQSLNAEFDRVNTSGRFSPKSALAEILSQRADVSIDPLRPETSTTLSAGVGYRFGHLTSINADYYRIIVSDRFGTSPAFELSMDEQALASAKMKNLDYPINSATFFQNLNNTVSDGLDIVARHAFYTAVGKVSVQGAFNINHTSVSHQGSATTPAQTRLQEYGQPKTKGRLSVHWQLDKLESVLTWRYIGSWQDQVSPNEESFQTFSALHLFDASVTWFPSPQLSLSLGIENLFDSYPDRATLQANRGLKYSRNAPYDTDGGAYYLRSEFTF